MQTKRMKLAVLIPTRGDRPRFFENCIRMMDAQTLQPDHFEIMNYPAESSGVDITQRYRRGYDNLRNRGFDLIAFIEDDDWYSPEYLESMVRAWERFECPDLFGTCYTIYYHIKLKAYYVMEHHDRSSAMNTLIRPDLTFDWCVDMEPFLDLHLWQTIPRRIVFHPDKHITLGIKHGVGMCGGGSHVLDEKGRIERRFYNADGGLLQNTLDPVSFEFYNNYFA